jgi:Asp-tRNA(Asn)/Glu-tRNA(Gln) amidotransferase A subunit family amidase
MALSWSMDKPGPICRSAEDCAVVFSAIHGPDGFDNSLTDFPFEWDSTADIRGMRVGYVEAEFAGDIESPDDRARANRPFNRATLETLRSLGARLVPITLPECPADYAYLVLFAEGAAAFDYTNPGMAEIAHLRKYAAYRLAPAVEYIQANRIRTKLMRDMAGIMADIDVYVTPTFVGPTNWLTNLTGHPEVILPHGFTERGTPVSFSVVGRLFGEEKALALAHAFQKATNFHLRHPKL